MRHGNTLDTSDTSDTYGKTGRVRTSVTIPGMTSEYDPDGMPDQLAPEPLYRQLAGILRARIERGDWQPGTLIPSEAQLQQTYELARTTVRAAVRVLVDEGLVVVAPQRGTYVRERT